MTSSPPWIRRFAWLTLSVLASSTGCADELPSYNELKGFRVLALRASPPTLSEGQSTILDALTFVDGEANPQLRYHWSWCPARLPAAAGGDCALDEAAFARLLGLAEGAIGFDLGTENTARLSYPGSPERYRAACANSVESGVTESFVFGCDSGFPISIRADITYGEQTIRIQKEVHLLFADLLANENPVLGPVSFATVDSPADPTLWPEDRPASLILGEHYEVQVAIDETSSERFVPSATEVDPAPAERRESLYLSWFTTTGEVKEGRTSFVTGGVSLPEFGSNEWTLPKSGDEKRDAARLFLVLRDERGGVSWLSREVELAR